jgi:hypothetical protein
MLVAAVAAWQVVLAVHITAVIVTFGVIFAYPVIYLFAAQLDPRAMPWYYRMRALLGRRLISPGLLLVLVAGIYLASDLHQWKLFYTQWGIAAVVIIGGIEGAFLGPREMKLARLADGDPSGAEYLALSRRVVMVDSLVLVLVLATVYVMTVQAG